ncbi:MAG: hypothetical protein ACOYKE_08650 [Ferruginibacter sp.]
MGDKINNNNDRDRRWFLSFFLPTKQNTVTEQPQPTEMVKMLTAEGKLVEIEKSVLDAVAKKQKSTNKEIYDWMNNPSKENK